MRREKFAIANIYVPIKRRAKLKPETVQESAQSILEVGQQAPILVRRDGDRFVLVHGLHRLEACRALGEETIYGYLGNVPPRATVKVKPCGTCATLTPRTVVLLLLGERDRHYSQRRP